MKPIKHLQSFSRWQDQTRTILDNGLPTRLGEIYNLELQHFKLAFVLNDDGHENLMADITGYYKRPAKGYSRPSSRISDE